MVSPLDDSPLSLITMSGGGESRRRTTSESDTAASSSMASLKWVDMGGMDEMESSEERDIAGPAGSCEAGRRDIWKTGDWAARDALRGGVSERDAQGCIEGENGVCGPGRGEEEEPGGERQREGGERRTASQA